MDIAERFEAPRVACKSFSFGADAVYNPFDDLPLDVVGEIFLSCLPESGHIDLDQSSPPWTLLKVSRGWRSAAFASSTLWSHLEIELNDSFTTPFYETRQRRMTEFCLRWSRSGPLSVRIVYPDSRARKRLSGRLTFSIPEPLLAQSHRWKSLELKIPSVAIMALFREGFDLSGIRCLSMDTRISRKQLSTSLPIRRLLERLDFNNLQKLEVFLDYENLLTLNECLEILAAGRNLRSFSANADCIFHDCGGMLVHHTSLRHLHITPQSATESMLTGHQYSSHFTRFLEQLEVPTLQSLRLDWLVRHTHPHLSLRRAVTTFVEKSAPAFELLQLSDCIIDPIRLH